MSKAVSARRPERRALHILLAAGLTIIALLLVALYGPHWTGLLLSRLDPDRLALRQALQGPAMADLRFAYASRYYQPIWMKGDGARPETQQWVRLVLRGDADGLRPADYGAAKLNSAVNRRYGDDRTAMIAAEIALSTAYGAYVADLHTPLAAADMVYTDPTLVAYRPRPAQAVMQVAGARKLAEGVAAGTRMNPIYEAYRRALLNQRSAPQPDPAAERALLINMERLRALPVNLGPRFLLVDAAAGQLWLYENGRAVDAMKVIVGTPQAQTPAMTGVMRYAVFNPSWNVPPDLTRLTYAPRIKGDRRLLDALGMDVWSDYSTGAKKLDPLYVDWSGVAAGYKSVWLRQRPGPENAMGAVKFMFPNSLGIYLHDTPRKALFAQETRLFSAGCVRVEDYRRLARWLWKGSDVRPAGDGADQKIDLPQPAPVYITYLTAAPVGGKVELRRDVYGRDAAVTAQMSGPRPRATDPVAAARPAIPGDITPAKAEAKGERELVLPPEEPVALRGGV